MALMGVTFFAGCSLVVRNLFGSRPDLSLAGIGLLLLVGPAAAFWWFRNRDLRKANEMLAAINPLHSL
jgi:hypothetical protein